MEACHSPRLPDHQRPRQLRSPGSPSLVAGPARVGVGASGEWVGGMQITRTHCRSGRCPPAQVIQAPIMALLLEQPLVGWHGRQPLAQALPKPCLVNNGAPMRGGAGRDKRNGQWAEHDVGQARMCTSHTMHVALRRTGAPHHALQASSTRASAAGGSLENTRSSSVRSRSAALPILWRAPRGMRRRARCQACPVPGVPGVATQSTCVWRQGQRAMTGPGPGSTECWREPGALIRSPHGQQLFIAGSNPPRPCIPSVYGQPDWPLTDLISPGRAASPARPQA